MTRFDLQQLLRPLCWAFRLLIGLIDDRRMKSTLKVRLIWTTSSILLSTSFGLLLPRSQRRVAKLERKCRFEPRILFKSELRLSIEVWQHTDSYLRSIIRMLRMLKDLPILVTETFLGRQQLFRIRFLFHNPRVSNLNFFELNK